MKINPKEFASALFANMGPLAPVLLVAAAASVWLACASVKSVSASIKTAQVSVTEKVVLKKTQITNDQALAAAQHLAKLAPATRIAISGKYVVVSISKPEQFAEWIHALTEAQSLLSGVQWDVETICIATCQGASAKAYITAYSQKLEVAR